MHSLLPTPVPGCKRLAAAAADPRRRASPRSFPSKSPAHKPAIMESPAPTVESASSFSGRAR